MNRKRTRRVLAGFLAFAMLGTAQPGILRVEAATKKLKVTSPKTVAVNCSIKIKTNVKCKFKSSNKKIATVNAKGVVKGKKAGNVRIIVTAKRGGKKKTLKIAVKNKLVVTIPKASTTLKVGDTATIKTNLASTFKSDSASVTVTGKGVIRAESPGSANITVTAKKFPKLKKTVGITVIGGQASSEPQPTAAPTQPSQVQPTPVVPKPTVMPSPDVPETLKTSEPATESSDIQESPEPTQSETQTPDISETPDVPETPKPSVTSAPTDTASPSTATPSETKQPIGITAEFEGKVPMNKAIGDAENCIYDVNKRSVIVKLKYADNTERILEFTEFSKTLSEVIEKDGKQFVETVITYENFSTTLQVEIVAVDSDIVYPKSIDVHYMGDTLKKGEEIDINDLEVKVIYTDYTSKIIDASEVSVDWVWDQYDDAGTKEYVYDIAYNYYFEYNGELLHTCALDEIYVPYE